MTAAEYPCRAPVLLLAFRRPDTTARVFQAIRQAQPAQLYVAANAPRSGNAEEAEQCAEVRRIVQAVDWDCSLHTLFRDEHLPVGESVSSAVTWFFEAVEAGIVLEDDCLPHATFFPFCSEMLERYRDASLVMQVAGYNFLGGSYESESDYLFSHFGWQWGWATWKRAWGCFDLHMTSWPQFKKLGLHEHFPFYPERVRVFDAVHAGKLATWDFQWHYAMAANSGLSVVSKTCLVENIGFGATSTNNKDASAGARYRIPVQPMPLPVKHPKFLCADLQYDRLLIRAVHRRSIRSHARAFASRLVRRLFPSLRT
jgi:hypothetical protein